MEFCTPFYIEKQESLATDKFSKNGRTLDLHIVAKNISFVVHIGASFDLNLSPPSAKLIYDFDKEEEQKEVEALKNVPLEYTAHVDETGHKAAVEAKISVLSSQHEGAYFRIKFSVTDPISQALLEDYSQPIKVISKRNQVKKMMERKQTKSLEASSPSPPTMQVTAVLPSKRAAPTSDISEVLNRMEQQHKEQMKLLQQLVSNSKDVQPIKQQMTIPDPDDMDFETAFANFLKSYTKIPQEERVSKIRKVLKNQETSAIDNLSQFVGIYSSAHPSDGQNCTDKTCKCQECPHKKELLRLDDFYNDFLSDPLSPSSPQEMV